MLRYSMAMAQLRNAAPIPHASQLRTLRHCLPGSNQIFRSHPPGSSRHFPASMNEVTTLLSALEQGDAHAADQLLPIN
jgi:hypothetical protein